MEKLTEENVREALKRVSKLNESKHCSSRVSRRTAFINIVHEESGIAKQNIAIALDRYDAANS